MYAGRQGVTRRSAPNCTHSPIIHPSPHHPPPHRRPRRPADLAQVGGGLTGVGLGLIFRQAPNGAAGRPFVRYTLPALELRQMLGRMRELNESFTLVYTRISGTPPRNDHAAAEAWRAEGCGRRITLVERARGGEGVGAGGGERSCTQLDTCQARDSLLSAWFLPAWWWAQEPCAPDEIGMLAARHEQPGWLASTLLLSNPYPILSPAGRYCGSSG